MVHLQVCTSGNVRCNGIEIQQTRRANRQAIGYIIQVHAQAKMGYEVVTDVQSVGYAIG